jgi:hypothetical protein
MKIQPTIFIFFCLFVLIFHRQVNANLVDELIEAQERNEKARLEEIASDRTTLMKNCKLPLANQPQLIEDVANYFEVNPRTVRVISTEVWGDKNKYCRAHIFHDKGTCFVSLKFDKYGSLTSSTQQIKNGQCKF